MMQKWVLVVLVLLLIGCASKGALVSGPEPELAPTRDAQEACKQYELDVQVAMMGIAGSLDYDDAQILPEFDRVVAELYTNKGVCGPRVDAAVQEMVDYFRALVAAILAEDFAAAGEIFITMDADIDRISAEIDAAMKEAQD